MVIHLFGSIGSDFPKRFGIVKYFPEEIAACLDPMRGLVTTSCIWRGLGISLFVPQEKPGVRERRQEDGVQVRFVFPGAVFFVVSCFFLAP
jgi:hypothetical protein